MTRLIRALCWQVIIPILCVGEREACLCHSEEVVASDQAAQIEAGPM